MNRRVITYVLTLLAVGLLGSAAPGNQAPPRGVTAIRNSDYLERRFPLSEEGIQQGLDFVHGAGGTVLLDSCDVVITRSIVVWDSTSLAGQGRLSVLRIKKDTKSRIRALIVGSHCRVSNLTLLGGGYGEHDRSPYGSRGIDIGRDLVAGAHASTIEGCILADWNSNAIEVTPHSAGNTIRGNEIYRSGWEGIYVAQFSDSTILRDNLIVDCRRNAIDVVSAGNQIIANTVRGVGLDSLIFSSDTFGILLYARQPTTGIVSDNLVTENIVERCHDGIAVLSGTGSYNMRATVEDNDVFANRRHGIWIGSESRGQPLAHVRGNIVRNNRVHGNGRHGIYLDRLPHDTRIRENEVFGNGDAGIYAWAVPQGTDSTWIVGNRVHNNRGYGVEVDSLVAHTTIRGNTIAANGAGAILDRGRKTVAVDNRVLGP